MFDLTNTRYQSSTCVFPRGFLVLVRWVRNSRIDLSLHNASSRLVTFRHTRACALRFSSKFSRNVSRPCLHQNVGMPPSGRALQQIVYVVQHCNVHCGRGRFSLHSACVFKCFQPQGCLRNSFCVSVAHRSAACTGQLATQAGRGEGDWGEGRARDGLGFVQSTVTQRQGQASPFSCQSLLRILSMCCTEHQETCCNPLSLSPPCCRAWARARQGRMGRAALHACARPHDCARERGGRV